MSLINRMLRDLDARQGEGGLPLPNDIRPLPGERRARLPIYLGLAAVVLAALAAAFHFYPPGRAAVEPAPSASTINAAPVSTPAVAQQLAPPPSEALVAPPAAAPAAAAVPAAVQFEPGSAYDLKLSQTADFSAYRPAALPAETKKAETRERPRPAADKPPAAVEKVPASPPLAGPSLARGGGSHIERSAATSTPRERADAAYRQAVGVVNQGRVPEGIAMLNGALRDDGTHVPARQLLLKLLFEARHYDEAMEILQAGLRQIPTQIAWAMSLARLQVERGDLAGAWQTLERGLPAAAGNADYQGFAGHVLFRLGRYKDAVLHYAAAARLAPGDGRWWLGLGLAYDADGYSTEAREALQRAKNSGTLSADLRALAEQRLR